MSAAVEDRDGLRKDADLVFRPLAAGAKVFNDTLVFNLAGAGFVGPGRAGVAGDKFVGVSQGRYDNTGGAAGAKGARIKRTGSFAFPFADGTPTVAINDQPAYAVDDSTVTATNSANAVKVGNLIFDPEIAAAGLVRVDVAKGIA